MILHSITKTLTLIAPFRTLGREHVGAISSLLQRIPGAGEGRAAHGHVWPAGPRWERVRRRDQALGYGDGPGRRRRPACRDGDRRDDRQERRAAEVLRCPSAGLPPARNRAADELG